LPGYDRSMQTGSCGLDWFTGADWWSQSSVLAAEWGSASKNRKGM